MEVDVLEIVEKILQAGVSLEDVRKVKEEVQKVEQEIERLREEIKKLEEKKAEILQRLPDGVRAFLEKEKTTRTTRTSSGKGGGGRVRVRVNGQEFDSLKEAYYHLFPDRQGKAYKFREELEKLAERGEITLEYL